jgi:hypothetical protein
VARLEGSKNKRPEKAYDEQYSQNGGKDEALFKAGRGVERAKRRDSPPTLWVMAGHDGGERDKVGLTNDEKYFGEGASEKFFRKRNGPVILYK